ncbi:RNA polymerase Rpb3/Rpb11 dimerization domain containing protein [Tritrichomonas foetus]|uniref:RNA polymerase Rpb3/Rpb11 dimerization domain containing protein n=1 Tax=Tritrichomonas foetus TaxID=1144522 RepID=A0A1J4KFI4_9EUKA|nr:RNA polymerase Rpb3/Rpb11 dimerization domain containing protein [Tritrichomonas foetus]|eukprot:OHT09688.1 RNA polymerase Rpb3/Rpb11 dimerization domain containing protein [Tritrichomonas foetus]
MEKQKCVISFDNNDPSSGSFLFDGETHTIGNALRQTIVSNPDVEFCAYSVPHPAETKIKIRIQCEEGKNIIEALGRGLDNFSQWCQNVEDAFDLSAAQFA